MARRSYSVQFDGINEYLSVPNNSAFDLGSGDFTFEAWVNSSASKEYGIIAGRWGGVATSGASSYALRQGTAASQKYQFVFTSNGSTEVQLVALNTFSLNRWYHVAVVRSGNNFSFYIDGVLQASTTNSSTIYAGSTNFTVAAANNGTDLMSGYVSNVRLIKGTALYSGNFTVPTGPYESITNTSLLLCRESTFIDVSGNNFTVNALNTPTISTFVPFYTTGIALRNTIPLTFSAYFPNVSSYAYTAASSVFEPGATGAWTLELWVYTAGGVFYAHGNGGPYGVAINVYYNGKFNLIQANGSNADVVNLSTTNSYPANRWHHVSVCKDASNVIRIFVNGVQDASTTYTGTIAGGANTRVIFNGIYDNNGFGQYGSTNRISNARWVKGTALYTSNFTPPTLPLTAIANTQLLTLNASTFRDSSTNNFTITTVGSPTISTNTPFGENLSNRLKFRNNIPYSVLFNGSSQYLTIADAAALRIGTSAFCIEAWVYMNSLTASVSIVFGKRTYNTTGTGTYYIFVDSAGIVKFNELQNVVTIVQSSAGAIQTGNWYHLAVTRDVSNLVRLFINGTLVSSNTSTFNFSSTQPIWIARDNAAAANYLNGYVSNVRLVIGDPVYIAAFTPPTFTLDAIANTVLLTCNSDTIKDSSSNNFTVTNVGGATVSTIAPFSINTKPSLKIYSVT